LRILPCGLVAPANGGKSGILRDGAGALYVERVVVEVLNCQLGGGSGCRTGNTVSWPIVAAPVNKGTKLSVPDPVIAAGGGAVGVETVVDVSAALVMTAEGASMNARWRQSADGFPRPALLTHRVRRPAARAAARLVLYLHAEPPGFSGDKDILRESLAGKWCRA